MSEVIQKIARGALAAGTALGLGSCAVDVLTCPGDVKRASHEVPANYCDEDPANNDSINNPGTPEQKLMLGGFVVVSVSAGVLWIGRKNEEDDPIATSTSDTIQ